MARTRDLDGQRARLSAATWSVLAEQGPQGLTVRAVAARAGCSTGLVMHAFPDKRALLKHARTLLHERTARYADAVTGTPEERLRGVLLRAASLTADKRDEARVWAGFLAAALGDEDLAELHRTYNRAFVARIQGLLAAARPGCDRAALAQHAKSLIALVEGLNALAAVDPRGYPPAAQRRAIEAALAAL
jgi:TetR/AcrR family transcriptional regulator, transcriptional repressor of bet genes